MKKYFIIGGVVLLAIVGGVWYALNRAKADTTQVKEEKVVAKVERGPLRVLVQSTGSVDPEQEVEIKCKASGEVIKVPVDISTEVKKGDLLAQLDPDDETRSVRKAEVTLAVSEANLAKAKLNLQSAELELSTAKIRTAAALKSAEASEREAEAKLKRTTMLLEKKMCSQEDMDDATSTHASAEASLESAHADVESLKLKEVDIETMKRNISIAEADVENNKLSLDDAREQLKDTTVLAPIDGVISEKDVQVGQIITSATSNVSGGTTILKLADLSRIYVLVTVDESDIGRVRNGQHAKITVDAYPNEAFRGKVVRIATKGVSTSNVVTFEVKVEVESEKRTLLKPEMTANVDITVVDHAEALLVPVAAVTQRRGEAFVVVHGADGKEEKRTVEVGESSGEKTEILKGVAEGETLVISGSGQSKWKAAEKTNDRRMRPPPIL